MNLGVGVEDSMAEGLGSSPSCASVLRLWEEKFQEKKATILLYLLLQHVVGCFEQLNLNMRAQSVFVGGDAQLLYGGINK